MCIYIYMYIYIYIYIYITLYIYIHVDINSCIYITEAGQGSWDPAWRTTGEACSSWRRRYIFEGL